MQAKPEVMEVSVSRKVQHSRRAEKTREGIAREEQTELGSSREDRLSQVAEVSGGLDLEGNAKQEGNNWGRKSCSCCRGK